MAQAAHDDCPSEDTLAEFVAGSLDEAGRGALEQHIDRCERCAATLALFGGAYATRGRPTEPEPGPDEAAAAPKSELFAGRYRIRECVGAGAGGTVYAAWDPELDRKVALKVLRGQAAGGSRGAHRVAREARVMAKVVHPNVVAVHDVGSTGDHVFIAAEFIDGCTLDAWRAAAPRTVAEIVEVFVAAGRGLAAIHDCGLVHRDFKPHNVMVGSDGRVCVTDFGLARLQRELDAGDMTASMEASGGPTMSPSMLAETLASQTRTGALVGTPAYMSPEQWRGDVADARSDQFSFCVALYEALYEVRPFAGRTSAELSTAVCEGRPRAPVGAAVPGWVVRAVMRGLERDVDRRFADMHALLAALTEVPRRQRRRRTIAALALGFVAVGGGAFALARLDRRGACTQAARLDPLWDAQAQREVSAVLGADYAPTAAHVEAWIDAWRAADQALCADDGAGAGAPIEAARTCLERRYSQMHAALAVMRESGERGAALAGMVETIPSPAECLDAGMRIAVQPEYRTPLGRVLAVQLAESLDRVEALRYAGRHDEAMAIAMAVLAQAEIDGDHALRAPAWLAVGQLHSARKDAALAEAALETAVWAAEASGYVEVAVDGWTELVVVIGALLERHDEALRAATRAHAALERLRDPGRGFALASDEALLHSLRGDYPRALAGQEQVLAQGIALYGAEHRQIARVHMNLAAVLTHLGRLDEAIAHAREGVALQRRLYPGPHPVTAEMLNILGALEVQRGDLEAARATLGEGLAMAEASLGRVHATRAGLLSNLASIDLQAGRPADAARGYTEVLSIYRALHDAHHPDIAMALHNLAGALDKGGDPQRAIDVYREALALRLVSSGPEHPSTANTMHNLGAILYAHGDLAEATAQLERALELRERANVDPWRRATTSFMLAKAYAKAGDGARAMAMAERARELLRGIAPRQAELLGTVEAWIADRAHRVAAPP